MGVACCAQAAVPVDKALPCDVTSAPIPPPSPSGSITLRQSFVRVRSGDSGAASIALLSATTIVVEPGSTDAQVCQNALRKRLLLWIADDSVVTPGVRRRRHTQAEFVFDHVFPASSELGEVCVRGARILAPAVRTLKQDEDGAKQRAPLAGARLQTSVRSEC